MRGIVRGTPEPIESQFNLSYATILNLYAKTGEEIFRVAEQNLSAFQAENKRKKSRLNKNYRSQVKQLRNRLRFLQKAGYLSGKTLTEKGRVAARINGYEVQIAELYAAGILYELSPEQLCVILSSLTYSPRRKDSSKYLKDPATRKQIKKTKKLMRRLIREEAGFNIADPVRPPDFRIDTPAMLWARGEDLETVEKNTRISSGDLVRTFRMTVQLIRQIIELPDIDAAFREAAVAALRKYKRDIVDAEAQLRKGIVETP